MFHFPGLTPYGNREVVLTGLFALVLCYIAVAVGLPWLCIVPAVLYGWALAFFRDPKRTPPENPNAVVSPADGTVTHVLERDEPDFVGGRALMVGIFLSIFNVHLNRAPFAGTVRFLAYRRGRFHDARSELSSGQNEANSIGIEIDRPGAPRVLVKQIAGAVARRIVCDVASGDRVERGQVVGMIKFGSRTEIYIPVDAGFTPKVQVGDKVKAGTTVLGDFA
ncbi:MAG: phosphatidylserine decarboxylase family protein [Planctomycetota bacterium]